MIWFIIFIVVATVISITIMVQKQMNSREIWLFVVIILLGFLDWISIFLDRKFDPNRVVASLIDWIGH